MRRGPVGAMAVVAAVVVAIDFASKHIAAIVAGSGDIVLGALRVTIVHNDLLVGGLSFGAATRGVNGALIVVLVALMAAVVRDLTAVDPGAPRMLGLLAGAALGNAVDLLSSGAGAMDFLAVDRGGGSEIAFNLADVALLAGLALCARTTLRILVAWRAQHVASLLPAVAAAAVGRPMEQEIARPLYVDGVRTAGGRPQLGPVRDTVVDLPSAPRETGT